MPNRVKASERVESELRSSSLDALVRAHFVIWPGRYRAKVHLGNESGRPVCGGSLLVNHTHHEPMTLVQINAWLATDADHEVCDRCVAAVGGMRPNDEDMQRHGSGASPATEAPR